MYEQLKGRSLSICCNILANFLSCFQVHRSLGINGYVPQACWEVRVLQHPGIKEKETSKRQAQFKKADIWALLTKFKQPYILEHIPFVSVYCITVQC